MLPHLPAGPTNSLLDVPGLTVGHHHQVGEGWLTGTTVVLAPPEGAVAGADVRGGGPGTRETDLLDPCNLVERVHAVTLSGGSAFGLAAADGVMRWLLEEVRGFPMGAPGHVVPIVPGAVIFDLGRGGEWSATPDASFGRAAAAAATADELPLGVVGAGTGAQVAGGLKGGIGSASATLPGGGVVACLVVLNAVGSTVDPNSGELYGARHLVDGDLDLPRMPPLTSLRTPDPAEVEAARARAVELGAEGLPRTLATTIGVVATDLTLTESQAQRLAMSGHDGMARAIAPAHTMFDGDTLFGLATCARAAPDPLAFHHALHASAEVVTRALVRATLAADTVTTSAGTWRAYRDAFPSAMA
ncbi:P1 family peptidase [Ornithinimicrobium sp. Y1694]|uniref:P1 family peptidase n=1 Tax=Ornithinimicrobium sp. Y1694 TaxID=3418590 RepID=UPI003CF92643